MRRGRLVQCIALARLPLAPARQRELLQSLAASLRAGSPAGQAAAAAALGALARAYPLSLNPSPGTNSATARGIAAGGVAEAPSGGVADPGAGPERVAEPDAVAGTTLAFAAALADVSGAARRGAAAALGALPARLLRPAAGVVLDALAAAALVRTPCAPAPASPCEACLRRATACALSTGRCT